MSYSSDSEDDNYKPKIAKMENTAVTTKTRRGLARSDSFNLDESFTENTIYTSKVSRSWHRPTSVVSTRPHTNDVKMVSNESKETTVEDDDRADTSLILPAEDRNESVHEVKDPTPPSTPKGGKKKRPAPKRLKKGVKSAMNVLKKMKTTIDKEDDDDDDDVVIINNETPQLAKNVTVKIRLSSGIKKFQIKLNESFSKIISSIAEAEEVDDDDVLLFFNDSTVHFYDSPKALGITVADILDCHIRRQTDLPAFPVPMETENMIKDAMLISLNLQMKDSKSKMTFTIRKDEPMEKLMRKFCNATGRKAGTCSFYSDGEILELSDTPESLDFETDYCIDVLDSV